MAIPLFDTATPLTPLREKLHAKVEAVLASGRYILGPEVAAFERELGAYLGARHVIGVANGTDAIMIGLRTLGVGLGDEVVVPSFTFYATAEAVAAVGAAPVFCDVDYATRNVTIDSVHAVLTSRTKAIVAVDLFGAPAPITQLRELGLPVLEDAAQAIGATLGGRRAGTLGDLGTLSFYPSKNLGCFGDGGAIVTDDDGIAEMTRSLRFHGSRDKETFEHIGYNSRLDELQAGVLRVLLPELDDWCAGRREAARAYGEAGLGEHVALPEVIEDAQPAWHLYVVTHRRPEQLRTELAARGVEARGYYRVPLHLQPAMRPFSVAQARLPVTEELARENLALPMGPVLGREQADEVAAAISAAGGQ